MERKIKKQVVGYKTIDGAGVHLVRVLGHTTVQEYDPILLLDSFDSRNPEDYKAGFPMHPHRGIETISYVYQGEMTHRDSLGHEDTVVSGEVQWMTAGSGIMHEEMLPASERLLGVQLWLNLPARDKMAPPAYHRIRRADIAEIELDHGKLRLLAGEYDGVKGYMSRYLPLDYYDLHLDAHTAMILKTDRARAVMMFTLVGDAYVGGEWVREKTAVSLTAGDHVEIKSTGQGAQILFISSMQLREPVSWGGPIVMNTQAELNQAFADLKKGTFLRHSISY